MSTLFDPERIEKAEKQIEEELTTVDYETKEYPVEIICHKYLEGIEEDENEIFLPDYQRDFVWSPERQSKFIESLFLGLPIPYIFVADNEGRLEIVDGSQRIRTIVAFLNDELVLQGLKKLTYLNQFKYSDLPLKRQRRFSRKTLRMIELTEKANEEVRRDIFERINTGSDELKAMEKRRGILTGPFNDVLNDCAKLPLFQSLCPISKGKIKRAEGPELVLRFFAYANRYTTFQHSVTDFLSNYMSDMNKETDFTNKKKDFNNMLEFAERLLGHGFARSPTHKTTPRVRFEALAVGIHLALKKNPHLTVSDNVEWISSKEFNKHTRSDASNSRPKVIGRIEYVRDELLGKR
jgi:uncharacterized protein with ParB-like and HNH nuclease domain